MYCLTESELSELFGPTLTVKFLDERDISEEIPPKCPISTLTVRLYLLKNKATRDMSVDEWLNDYWRKGL